MKKYINSNTVEQPSFDRFLDVLEKYLFYLLQFGNINQGTWVLQLSYSNLPNFPKKSGAGMKHPTNLT